MDSKINWAELEEALDGWLKRHPAATERTMIFSGTAYSPQELVTAIKARTETGVRFASTLYEAARKFGFSVPEVIGASYAQQEENTWSR